MENVMTIEFTGRRTAVAKPLRRLGERKLDKLARLLPGITRAHVVLSKGRHRQVAEVSVRSPRLDLLAREVGPDFGISLAKAFDKLERQAQHQLGKLRGRKWRSGSPRRAEERSGPPPPAPRGGEPRVRPTRPRVAAPVLRVRRVAVPLLSRAAAARELGQTSEELLVFKDEATERLCVLFRGKDGRLGLLEPEA
jgi:putative sigma-54 modulation protein